MLLSFSVEWKQALDRENHSNTMGAYYPALIAVLLTCVTITKEFHALCLREVIIRIPMSTCPLLNLLCDINIIGKIYLWDCRKKQVLPNIEGFKSEVRIKYQVETIRMMLHSG